MSPQPLHGHQCTINTPALSVDFGKLTRLVTEPRYYWVRQHEDPSQSGWAGSYTRKHRLVSTISWSVCVCTGAKIRTHKIQNRRCISLIAWREISACHFCHLRRCKAWGNSGAVGPW
ncbi:hypothetical protein LIA77_10327 [Sarocladium implicatum]|nr:hypothetical protein LIA77_10327 [Sarocladium implicatum]